MKYVIDLISLYLQITAKSVLYAVYWKSGNKNGETIYNMKNTNIKDLFLPIETFIPFFTSSSMTSVDLSNSGAMVTMATLLRSLPYMSYTSWMPLWYVVMKSGLWAPFFSLQMKGPSRCKPAKWFSLHCILIHLKPIFYTYLKIIRFKHAWFHPWT